MSTAVRYSLNCQPAFELLGKILILLKWRCLMKKHAWRTYAWAMAVHHEGTYKVPAVTVSGWRAEYSPRHTPWYKTTLFRLANSASSVPDFGRRQLHKIPTTSKALSVQRKTPISHNWFCEFSLAPLAPKVTHHLVRCCMGQGHISKIP